MKNLRLKLKSLSIILIPFLLYVFTQLYYFLSNTDFKKRLYIPTHLFGLFILILVFIAFTAIFGSSKISSLIISVVLLIFMITNQVKIGFSLNPIMFSDFYFLQDTGSLLDITGTSMLKMILKAIPTALLYALALVGINIVATFLEIKPRSTSIRIFSAVLCTGILIVIYYPNTNVTLFMQEHIFDKVTSDDDNHTTTNIAYYQKHGVIAGMYGMLLSNRFIEPECYDKLENKLDDIMLTATAVHSEYIAQNEHNWGQPNIIMIFSESFWDIDKLDEISFDRPITSNLQKLKDKGIYAEMISPSYGGVSANVEYEVLTGSNIQYFAEGYIPYMQLINNSSFYDAPYVSTTLRENGYETQIVSTWKNTLFNCQRVYDYMKIDETSFMTDFTEPDMKGGRISEKAIVDEIIDELSTKEQGQKIFHMSLTAQAHMPYYKDRYEEYDVNITSSSLSTSLNEMIQCYAQGVYDADRQLARLYDFIQDYDEPTIIIFYGDHLPYLNNSDGEDAYKELEYFNTGDELTDIFRKYNTQLLITGNFDLGVDDIDYIGPELVMPYVFWHCDFENTSPYYDYLASTVHTLPSFNCFVAVDSNGKLYSPDNLPSDMKEIYDIRRCINWREFVAR